MSERLYAPRIVESKNPLFPQTYISKDFLVAGTNPDSPLAGAMFQQLNEQGLDWLRRTDFWVVSRNSRDLFQGKLDLGENGESQGIIIKKSKRSKYGNEVATAHEELLSNRALAQVVADLRDQGSFNGLTEAYPTTSVRVEEPIGMVVDRRTNDRYSAFVQETGYVSGEELNWIEPLDGIHISEPHLWNMWLNLGYSMDLVRDEAQNRGMRVGDWGMHQALFDADAANGHMDVVIVDTERVRLPKA
jgi:hypothetical protein